MNTIQTNVETAAPAPVILAFDPSKTYATGDKFLITFDGKPITVTFVRPGVVQKTASIFYIRDAVNGEWLYCFPQRLETLIKKGVDLANYKGRDTKAAERKAEKSQKAEQAVARKVAAEAAAKAALEKVQNTVPVIKEVETAPVAQTETAPIPPATEPLAEVAAAEEAQAKATKKAAAKK